MININNFSAPMKKLSQASKTIGAASALLAASLLFPLNANAINGQGFNAIIFGDLNASGGDTEGRLAVGGDMLLPSSYSVGDCSSGPIICAEPGNSLPRSTDGSRIDLIVGGDITGNANWGMNSGSARIGGNINGVSITTASGSPNTIVSGLGVNIPFDFDATKTNLIGDSASLSTLLDTVGTSVERTAWSLTLAGTDPDLNVFNIDAATWAGSTGFTRYIDVPEGSQVVINVSGETVDISGGQVNFGTAGCLDPIFGIFPSCQNPIEAASNTIVNYYEATTINMNGFEHQGSMLAPTATLTISGGAINGQTVVASANTSNGFEFHYRNFGGSFLDDSLFPNTSTDPDTGSENTDSTPTTPDSGSDIAQVPEPATVLGLLGLGAL